MESILLLISVGSYVTLQRHIPMMKMLRYLLEANTSLIRKGEKVKTHNLGRLWLLLILTQ